VHPRIVLGSFAFSAYYALIATGLTLGTFVLRREAVRAGLRSRDVFDMVLAVAPGILVFGRLLVVLDDPGRYVRHPLDLLSPATGWTSYGALLGTLGAVVVVSRWKGLDVWRVADCFAPAILFGHAFGRMGCLAAGCCHGRPADWPLGVEVPWSVRYYLPRFTRTDLIAVPLHPAPLYEALLVLGLYVLATARRDRRRYPGEALVILLGGYGIGRFVIEFFRGDLHRGTLLAGWITVGQGMALGMLAVAVAAHLVRSSSACTPS
jgi:phosphatidylglycerol:prolipoprotein diacylglycerol transferase